MVLAVVSAVRDMSGDIEDFCGQCARARAAVLEVGETIVSRLIQWPTTPVLESGIEFRQAAFSVT